MVMDVVMIGETPCAAWVDITDNSGITHAMKYLIA